MPQVLITGVGCITPSVAGFDDLKRCTARTWGQSQKEIADIPPLEGVNGRELRRLSRLARMAVYAADQAIRHSGCNKQKTALAVALTHGSTSLLLEFHDLLFQYGPEGVSPSAFSNGVTNAPLSTISTVLGMTAGGVTFIGFENCGLDLLSHASTLVANGAFGACVAGAAEEYSPVVESVYARTGRFTGAMPQWLPWCGPDGKRKEGGIGVSEGAAFFSLEQATGGPLSRAICMYAPVDDILSCPADIDLIISGASGGDHDIHEFTAIDNLQKSLPFSVPVLFTKPFFGECFALGSALSAAIACDILYNGTVYPRYPAHPALTGNSINFTSGAGIGSILVVQGSRDGRISSGLFTKVKH